MNISMRSLSHILRLDLGLGGYKHCMSIIRCKIQTNMLWKVQKVTKKVLKTHYRILFTDKKIFNIEENFNRQNDYIYAKSFYEAKDKIFDPLSIHQILSPVI